MWWLKAELNCLVKKKTQKHPAFMDDFPPWFGISWLKVITIERFCYNIYNYLIEYSPYWKIFRIWNKLTSVVFIIFPDFLSKTTFDHVLRTIPKAKKHVSIFWWQFFFNTQTDKICISNSPYILSFGVVDYVILIIL